MEMQPKQIGSYRVLESLGRGGMGVAYRAQHEGSGAVVALKTVRMAREGLLQSVRREIHALSRLRHRGIVRIVDEGVEDGLPWYAMELLEGQTLRRWVQAHGCESTPAGEAALTVTAGRQAATTSEGDSEAERVGCAQMALRPAPTSPPPADEGRVAAGHCRAASDPSVDSGRPPVLRAVLTQIRKLCSALAYLHGEGLVHRDLKPDNVLIVPARKTCSGEGGAAVPAPDPARVAAASWPVLVDFGLATQFSGPLSRDTLELQGLGGGTVAYMAPEQIRGELVDARADLYALGCILYELVCGGPPFSFVLASDVLRRDARGTWQVTRGGGEDAGEPDYSRLGLPRAVLDLVVFRLRDLPADAAAIVAAAAVLGRETTAAWAGAVARLDGPNFLQGRAELLRRHVLEETEAGHLRFTHDKLREATAQMLGSQQRRALHREADIAIEALPAVDRERHQTMLGQHWEEAGVRTNARAAYLAAAKTVLAQCAYGVAENLYRAYLRLTDKLDGESVAVRRTLAYSVLFQQGRLPEAVREQEQALCEARALGDRQAEAAGLGILSGLQRHIGMLEEAEATAAQALALCRDIAARKDEGTALAELAGIQLIRGRVDEAMVNLREAMAIARAHAQPQMEGSVLNNMAIALLKSGRRAEAKAAYGQAAEIFRRVGARAQEATTLLGLGILAAEQGEADAQSFLEAACAIHGGLGNRVGEAYALSNLGQWLQMQQRPLEARAAYERGLAIHREVRDAKMEGATLANLAAVCGELGQPEEARRLLQEALEGLRRVGEKRFTGIALLHGAVLARRTGDCGEAGRLLAAAQAALMPFGDRTSALSLIRARMPPLAGGGPEGAISRRRRPGGGIGRSDVAGATWGAARRGLATKLVLGADI
ncbi:MAG: serine/threonine protein kinase [Candidatus Schekmanbacteria bacterium]|nr:serine/threonine protein kinase [Candidatus Schekmanbacteria bacterium]